MIIRRAEGNANGFVACDDYGRQKGSASVQRAYQPMALAKRPAVYTVQVQAAEESAFSMLLAAATTKALHSAAAEETSACVRVEMTPEEALACQEQLCSLGFTGRSALLRMEATLPANSPVPDVPEGLTVIRDYLNDAQEQAFFLERTNALFGSGHDERWLSQMRAQPHFARMLLVDESGAVAELSCHMEEEQAVVSSLWVHPDRRRQGLATFLLGFAQGFWAEYGAQRVRMDIWSRYVPAVMLAKKLGMVPTTALVEYPYRDVEKSDEEN